MWTEPGRGEKQNGAVGGARAIAIPGSSSSVMGCMIYVVDAAVVRPFSTAAPFRFVPSKRGSDHAIRSTKN